MRNPHFADMTNGKRVIFITTKNIDYIRNMQEIRLLKENAKSVKIIYSKKGNYALRLAEIWLKLLKLKTSEVDIIFIGFSPQLVLPFFCRKLSGKTVIIDFFISVYDTMICDRKKFRNGGIVSRLCRWLDEKTIAKADYVIADTKADEGYFKAEFNGDGKSFETVYLEADKTIYYPRAQKKKDILLDKFVVLYFASMLPLQGVDIVLETVKSFKEEKGIFFQIIGPVSKRYEKPIQDNTEYIDWLEQEKLAEYIANADLCLAGHFNGTIEKARRTIPGKAYIYEAMGKSMILGDNAANRELFVEDSSHTFVEMGNSVALEQEIRRRYAEWTVQSKS